MLTKEYRCYRHCKMRPTNRRNVVSSGCSCPLAPDHLIRSLFFVVCPSFSINERQSSFKLRVSYPCASGPNCEQAKRSGTQAIMRRTGYQAIFQPTTPSHPISCLLSPPPPPVPVKVIAMRAQLQEKSQKRALLVDQRTKDDEIFATHAINEPEFGDRKAEHQVLSSKIASVR